MKWKWPEPPAWLPMPPSWHAIRVINGVFALAFIGLAIITENKWMSLFDALFAGIQIGLMLQASSMIQMRKIFDRMSENFDQMSQLNHALIHDKVMFHITGQPDDDTPPIAPKLH